MDEVAGHERRSDTPAGLDTQSRLRRYQEAFADHDAPFAFVDLDAMWGNAEQMLARAGDKPIRVPSKSLRCRPLQRGHIAGFGDNVAGKRLQNALVGWMQRQSIAELRERRARAVELVREVADLKIVNAGGTGDLQLVAQEPAVTEATAGSGFYAPTLFDSYSSFTLQPAAMFALPVSRRPDAKTATALGGGSLASGVGAKDRMPTPYLPPGLMLDPMEGTGEVQTPLYGHATRRLKVGDKVYFRHTKAGELCERFDCLHLVRGAQIVDTVPTYRGEGRAFL